MNIVQYEKRVQADMLEKALETMLMGVSEEKREKLRQPYRAIKASNSLNDRLYFLNDPGKTPEEIYELAEEMREIADYLESLLSGVEAFIAAHPKLRRRFAEWGEK